MKWRADELPPKPEWRQPTYKDVVRGQFSFYEYLPHPLVNYPDIYGSWIFFQESEGSQPMLCSCMRSAAKNLLSLTECAWWFQSAKDENLLVYLIPPRLREFNAHRIKRASELTDAPIFHPSACHLCNRRVPSIRWSNLDEHSAFLQHFGWYFHHALYAAGISPYGEVLQEELDAELRSLVVLDQRQTQSKIRDLMSPRTLPSSFLDGPPLPCDSPQICQARELHHQLQRQKKAVWLLIERCLRRAFGFPEHGKAGVSKPFCTGS